LGEMLLWQLLLGREAHLVGNMHEAEAELQWQLDDRKKRYDDECQRYQETESRLSSRNRHGRG
jgi:hypothetical protein